MAAEHFFNRWARPKPPLHDGANLIPASNPAPNPVASTAELTDEPALPGARALPTLADAARLNQDSDFSPFLAQGVDETVKRTALKKLFANPHFNVMDGLDTYIDDYGKADPIPPEMLALLNHAKDLLNPLAQCEKPSMELIAPEKIPEDDAGQESVPLPDVNAAQEMPPEQPSAPISDQAPLAPASASAVPINRRDPA